MTQRFNSTACVRALKEKAVCLYDMGLTISYPWAPIDLCFAYPILYTAPKYSISTCI